MVLNGLNVLNGVKFPPTVWIKVHPFERQSYAVMDSVHLISDFDVFLYSPEA